MAVKPDRKAINMKSFASSFIAFVLLANSSPALCDEAALLQMLKKNPAGNPETAHWFASLSLQKKRAYAAQIGHIVLEADTDIKQTNFVVAFGADQSPYPWAFIVRKDRLELCRGNSFAYVLRDDKWVKHQWGVYWAVDQEYRTEGTRDKIVFRQQSILKGTAGFDLWIPASGWQYVGAKLPKSDLVLRKPGFPPG